MSAYVQPAALANSARLNRSWINKAVTLGLINPSTLDGEDLIVVRVFAFVDQLVWPGQSRSRSEARVIEPWQSLAVNTARAAARDPATRQDSILWVAPDGVEVTHEPGAHSAFVLSRPRSMFAAVPLGEWIAELPPHLETLFHWPRQIMDSAIPVDGSTRVPLRVFSTSPGLVTVFASAVAPLHGEAYEKIIRYVTAHHSGSSIRLIEWLRSTTQSQWSEFYELPRGGLVRRPLDHSSLLEEFGPQLKRLDPGMP
ncbi:hypothetical protein ACFVFH_29225 [Streptomyces sp. NPDC057697]|uniref:hypothetical protein n=1 Tax=Streptomyces sp. NPDC057697 TaxID=3346219 RepID=UPI00367540E8